MNARRILLAVLACAISSFAAVTGSAQAQSRPHGTSDLGMLPSLVKHKGGKTYLYCASGIGCSAELVVYSKTDTFEYFEDYEGYMVYESGVVEKVKIGKKKYTDFRTTSEHGDGCIEVGVKTKTGYNSEAEQRAFECPEGPDGEYVVVETWYATK